MGWTKQQQNAIDARDSSIIVSAAAGSGKTSVLTERLVRLIADPASGVRADRMIVVTFTNDAAAEMKKRLDKSLRELINQDPGNRHLLKQQTLLQSARISTINSFCFELIRDNITDQGITSGFGIMDDTENRALKAQAMEELLNWYIENEYEKISFLYDKFCIKNERVLVEVISLADEFLASVALRDKWLEDAEREYHKDFGSSVYYIELMNMVRKKAEKALRLADDCLSMMELIFHDKENYPQAQASFVQAEKEYDQVSELADIIKSGRFPNEDEAERLRSFSSVQTVGAKTPHNKELRAIYRKKRDIMIDMIPEIISAGATAESDFRESAEVTFVLIEILKKYQEIIWEKKCRKNTVSFEDGERLVLEILADTDENGRIVPSETAKRTADFYDIIMIDEYQDSNNKQDLIFKLISKNYKHTPDGEPMYGDNVFLVGDVKQAIYGFRLANPKNFIDTLSTSEKYDPESDCPNKSIVLNKNFRSSHGVIDFVNYVFGQIMSENCGGIDYNNDEKLYFGAEMYDKAGDSCLTEIALINDNTPAEDDDEQMNAQINYEAEYTADRIASMINEKYPVIVGKETRDCRPSDFGILVRTNKYINIYAKALNDRGIPARTGEEKGYLKSREIAVLIDLLRVIDNPLSDIPVAAVLTSPMFMFTIQELAYIKSIDKEKRIYPIILGIADGIYPECTNAAFIGKCRDFLSFVDSFRLSAVTMTIGELINLIYDTTDFISVMQMSKDGEKKRANLRLLIQYAQNYEGSSSYEGTGGLGGFLRHIDRVLETGDYKQGKSAVESGDYVVIQTFHGSKGLEYPFVFIAETSNKFRCDSQNVMFSADGRIGYNLYDPKLIRRYKTFQQIMLHDEEKVNVCSEEMRLLYVGLTRAKQKLFINLKAGESAMKRVKGLIDRIQLKNGDISEEVSEAGIFADWLWASLIIHNDFAEALKQISVDVPQTFIKFHEKLFDVVVAEPVGQAVQTQNTETENENPMPDPEICREIMEMINTDYDRSLSDMPAKLSVTQIIRKVKGEDEEFDFRLKRPKFISGDDGLTGAERGTAIHTYFQYCDFDSAIENPEAELERLILMGYLSKIQAEAVDTGRIRAFFESSLYRRMTAAKQVWREKKFMVAVAHLDIDSALMEILKKSDGMIKGIVDMMFEENDGLVIVDYKSDRGISAKELAKRYSVQLRLYKSAVELTMKKNVKAVYLYSIELGKEIPMEI